MRILGIDPGIARTGWGIIEEEKGTVKALAFDCLETDCKEETVKRLETIHKRITGIIKQFSPDALAIEELFFNSNAKTAFVVGQARGVILLSAAQTKIPSFTYTPLEVKIAVTGYGRAEKNQVGQMVKTILSLKDVPKPDDTADALAVAITHSFQRRIPKK